MEMSQACYRILEEISRTIDLGELEKTEELLEALTQAKRVFVAGAGRSGLMVRSFAQRLMQIGIDTYVVGETTTPEIHDGDLILIGSGSGRTGGPVSYARIGLPASRRSFNSLTSSSDSPHPPRRCTMRRIPRARCSPWGHFSSRPCSFTSTHSSSC